MTSPKVSRLEGNQHLIKNEIYVKDEPAVDNIEEDSMCNQLSKFEESQKRIDSRLKISIKQLQKNEQKRKIHLKEELNQENSRVSDLHHLKKKFKTTPKRSNLRPQEKEDVTIDLAEEANRNPQIPSENEDPWPYMTNFYMFKERRDDNFLFECRQCLPTVKVISTSHKSRNNLKKHIESKHIESLQEFEICIKEGSKATKRKKRSSSNPENGRKRQHTLLEVKAVPSRAKVVTKSVFEERILNIFVENMLPLQIIESESFKSLLQLVPCNHSLSRRSLTRAVEDRFNCQKQKLKDILQELPSVATTADAWTCRNRSYLGMTVHWIDRATLKRRKAALACKRLNGHHTYDVIAKSIQDIHCTFGIENKTYRTTTDNGSNFFKAFNFFGEQESDEQNEDVEDGAEISEVTNLLEEAKRDEQVEYDLPKHSRCAAHTLNLIATIDADRALIKNASYKKAYRSAFSKARDLWNKQHRSSLSSDTIKENVGKLLVFPTVTRWNSVYDAVVRLVDIFDDKDMFMGLKKACSSLETPCFNSSDVDFLKEYRLVMQPLAKCLDILQGEENAYLGALLPTLAICFKTLKDYRENQISLLCQPLVQSLMEGFVERFGDTFDNFDCLLSSALNPQFKLAIWPKWIPTNQNIELLKERVTTQLSTLLEKSLEDNQKQNSSEGEEANLDDYFGVLYDIGKKRVETRNMVNMFLEEKTHKNVCSNSFPCESMLDLFVKYNTPIPSSAAVGLFTIGKDTLEPKRVGLSDEHFEMLVFLKANETLINL